MVSRSLRFPSPLNILRIWPRKSHNFALDSCRFYGMGLPMKRNSDHPGIPAAWAAAPEDTGDCRFPSSPVALPPMRHGSRDCGTKPRCHPEPVERVALSPTSALNSSPSALPATRAPFVTSPHLTKTDWIWLDLPGFAWIPLRIFPRHDASPQPKTARSRGSRVLTLSPIHLITPSSPSRIYLDLPGFGRPLPSGFALPATGPHFVTSPRLIKTGFPSFPTEGLGMDPSVPQSRDPFRGWGRRKPVVCPNGNRTAASHR